MKERGSLYYEGAGLKRGENGERRRETGKESVPEIGKRNDVWGNQSD